MIVLACEGKSELDLVNLLLDEGKLCFTRDDLLDHRAHHVRQLNDIAALIQILPMQTELIVYRIGDTQKDEYDLSRFKIRRDSGLLDIRKVCTRPEIEILVIIGEGQWDDFLKKKSKIKPKQFVKASIKEYSSFSDYLKAKDVDEIVMAIREYKRLIKNKPGEMYLADLLMEN